MFYAHPVAVAAFIRHANRSPLAEDLLWRIRVRLVSITEAKARVRDLRERGVFVSSFEVI